MIRLPTQRTRTRITTPKPLEQTRIMKHILARRTTFRRQFFGFVDNRVTNRTFHVAFERSRDVFAKGCERVGDVAVLDEDVLVSFDGEEEEGIYIQKLTLKVMVP